MRRLNLVNFAILLGVLLESTTATLLPRGHRSWSCQTNAKLNSVSADDHPNEFVKADLRTTPRLLDRSCRDERLNLANLRLTAPQLIKAKGFPVEEHEVVTQGGYILGLHRIPRRTAKSKGTVLIHHGMFQSSRDWLLQCGRKALPYKLWDAGYDVWLANVRGNRYSNRHKTLNPEKSAKYWNFTVDNLIKYDAPAIVDYVLAQSGRPSLTWIGFSLGTAVAMGFLSTQLAYNDKVNLFVSLATVAYVGNTNLPVLRLIASFHREQVAWADRTTGGQMLGPRFLSAVHQLLPLVCLPESVLNVPLYCHYFMGSVLGVNANQANSKLMAMLTAGTPNSWSMKVVAQWFQWIEQDRLTYFDYGAKGNRVAYGGSPNPPSYNISRVTTKVANFWSDNDGVSAPEDVRRTLADLPNVVADVRVPMPRWTHLDWSYGRDADIFVYEPIIRVIRKFVKAS